MLSLLAETFSLGLTATALLVLRMLMTPLVIYNMMWSWKGFRWMTKGAAFPTSIYQSVVFLMSTGLLGYNCLVFLGRTVSPWSLPYALIFLCLFFLASLMAFIGHRYAAVGNFEKFYWLFNDGHLDIAVRMAELHRIDPEYADSSLVAAETTLAIRMAQKAVNGEPN